MLRLERSSVCFATGKSPSDSVEVQSHGTVNSRHDLLFHVNILFYRWHRHQG